MAVEMEGLSFEITTTADEAGRSLSSLTSRLNRLKNATAGASRGIKDISSSMRAIDSGSKTMRGTVQTMKDTGDEASRAANKVEFLRNTLSKLKTGMAGVGHIFKFAFESVVKTGSILAQVTGLKAFAGAVSNITSKLGGLLSSFIRIAKYRAIRAVIAALTKGFQEGTKNIYEYSRATNNIFAKNMDKIATSTNYMKNSLGAVAAPLLNIITPAIQVVIDKFVDLSNVVAQFFASLSGATTYTAAKKVSTTWEDTMNSTQKKTKDTARKIKETILGFDEINRIDSTQGSSSGTDTPDYANMFEERNIENRVAGFANSLKNLISNDGDWEAVGSTLATKLNSVFDPQKFTQVGTNLGTIINNGIAFMSGFIKTLNTENIGASLAKFLKGAIKTIDWKLLGSTMVDVVWKGIEFTWGFIKNFPAKETAQAISSFIIGAFTSFAKKIGGTDWKDVGKTCVQKLGDFFTGLDWKGVWDSAWSLIAEAFGAAVNFGVGVTEEVWNGITTWWDKEIVNNPDGEGIGKNLWDSIVGWIDGAAGGMSKAFVNSSWFDNMNKGVDDWLRSWSDSEKWQKGIDYLVAERDEVAKVLNEEGFFAAIKTKWKIWSTTMGEYWSTVGEKWKSKFGKIFSSIGDLWNKLKEPFMAIGDWFKDIFGKLKDVVGGFVDKFKDKWAVIKDRIDKAKDWFQLLWDKISYLFTGVGAWFESKFKKAFSKVKDAFSPIKQFFKDKWGDIKDAFSTVGTWFKGKFDEALGKIKDVFGPIIGWFKGVWKDIKEKFNPENKPIADWFEGKFSDAYSKIKSVFGGIVDWFGNLWEGKDGKGGIKGAFTSIGSNIASAVGGAFKSVVNSIITTLENIINGGVNLINKFIKFINDITPGKDLSELKEVKFGRLETGGVIEHKQVHKFDRGGLPSYGSMFVAGENGAEIVGNINGRTEVLNRFQLGDVMQTSILSSIKLIVPYIGSVKDKIAEATNAIIASSVYAADMVVAQISNYQTPRTQPTSWNPAYNGYNVDESRIYENVRVGVTEAVSRQNDLLREQNELLKAIAAKDTTVEIPINSIVNGIAAKNRRDGREIIPVRV